MASTKQVKTILAELGQALEKQMTATGINPRDPGQVKPFLDGMRLPSILTTMITEDQDRE